MFQLNQTNKTKIAYCLVGLFMIMMIFSLSSKTNAITEDGYFSRLAVDEWYEFTKDELITANPTIGNEYKYTMSNNSFNVDYTTFTNYTGIYPANYTFTEIPHYQKAPYINNSYVNLGNYSIVDTPVLFHDNAIKTHSANNNWSDGWGWMGCWNISLNWLGSTNYLNWSWHYLSDKVDNYVNNYLSIENTSSITVNHWKNMFQVYYGGSWHDLGITVTANTWYYFSVFIDNVLGKFTLDINNTRYLTDISIWGGSRLNPTICRLVQNYGSTGSYNTYFDAMDFSNSSGYYFKRNYNQTIITTITPQRTEIVGGFTEESHKYYYIHQFAFQKQANYSFFYFMIDFLGTLASEDWIRVNVSVYPTNVTIVMRTWDAYYSSPTGYTQKIESLDVGNWTDLEFNIHGLLYSATSFKTQVETRVNQTNANIYSTDMYLAGADTSDISNMQFDVWAYTSGLNLTLNNTVTQFRSMVSYVPAYPTQVRFVNFIYDVWNKVPVPPTVPAPDYDTRPYWEYVTYDIIVVETTETFIGGETYNWTIGFNVTGAQSKTLRFHYDDAYTLQRMWGDWGIFEWLKIAFSWIVGVFWYAIQYLGFLFTVLVMYVLWGLCANFIVPFFWNILVYWLYIGLNWVAYAIVWVFMNMPLVLSAIFYIVAVIIAGIAWALSGGTLDYNTVLNNVNSVFQAILDYITNFIVTFIENLDAILMFAVFYMAILGMLYLSQMVAKARGYTNLASKLGESLDAYLMPVRFIIGLFSEIKAIIY